MRLWRIGTFPYTAEQACISEADCEAFGDEKAVIWGHWITAFETCETGGLKMAAVTAVIASAAPSAAVRVISSVAGVVAGNYDTVLVEIKMRCGTDKEYQYYERQISFYGDNERVPFYGPVWDSGKKTIER